MPNLSMKMIGTAGLLADLDKKEKRYAAGMEAGLVRAGLFLQRSSQQFVPIQTGNLRGSAFTRKEGGGLKTEVLVGYTASYAVFVHEDLDAAHGPVFNAKYAAEIAAAPANHPFFFRRGPNQQAKFLEKPFREKRKRMAKIVADHMT
jgi:hypothetical protein